MSTVTSTSTPQANLRNDSVRENEANDWLPEQTAEADNLHEIIRNPMRHGAVSKHTRHTSHWPQSRDVTLNAVPPNSMIRNCTAPVTTKMPAKREFLERPLTTSRMRREVIAHMKSLEHL